MRSVLVLALEAGPATGPDLTRYLLVCAGLIAGLLALAWLFRRHVAAPLRARAAKRSLQVLDVLPLAGKQKLVVVRCYDRSFLLGVGEKEVRAIAELAGAAPPRSASEASWVLGAAPPQPASAASGSTGAAPPRRDFSTTLEQELGHELVVQPAAPRAPAPDLGKGVLA